MTHVFGTEKLPITINHRQIKMYGCYHQRANPKSNPNSISLLLAYYFHVLCFHTDFCTARQSLLDVDLALNLLLLITHDWSHATVSVIFITNNTFIRYEPIDHWMFLLELNNKWCNGVAQFLDSLTDSLHTGIKQLLISL